jgi:hypothetical protein
MRIGTSLVAVAAVLATAPVAQAGVVVVLSVSGDDSGDLESLLGDAVVARHKLIHSSDWERAGRRLDLGSSSPREIAAIARDLEADAVVDASLRRVDGEYVLKIKLRDHTGETAKTVLVRMRAPKLGPEGKREVIREVSDALDRVLRARRDDDRPRRDDNDDRSTRRDDDDDDRSTRRDDDDDDDRSARRDDDDDDDDRPSRRRDDEDDEDQDDDDRDEDDEDDDRRRRRRDSGEREIRRAGIIVETGAMALSRTLTFSSRANFEQAPKGYKGAFVPAARVAVEIYPVALAAPDSVAGGLGLYAVYERAFLLTTRSDQSPDIKLTTDQSRLEVGARFRYAFGSSPTLPSVTLSVGYARRAFVVDRTPLADRPPLDLPDVDYRAIEPGLSLRIPLGTERLAFGLGAQALLMRSTGSIQTPEQYGAAEVTGLAGGAYIDAAITRRIMLRLRADVTQVGFDFTGSGLMSNMRDADPGQDVGGAVDRWLGTAADLAVVY